MKYAASALVALCLASGAGAEQATVAVATNFAGTMARLEAVFEGAQAHDLTVVNGSTGQLYAQIVNGAPYDVFLAADGDRPRRLTEAGLGSNPVTYALGRLALWTREPRFAGGVRIGDLAGAEFRRLGIANPRLAPYGVAAVETLQSLGFWESLEKKIVLGENVGQAFALVETRNAELGLVALASALAYEGMATYEPVPAQYHGPIRQDAILLHRGRDNPAAEAFMSFLHSPQARLTIADTGYDLP